MLIFRHSYIEKRLDLEEGLFKSTNSFVNRISSLTQEQNASQIKIFVVLNKPEDDAHNWF